MSSSVVKDSDSDQQPKRRRRNSHDVDRPNFTRQSTSSPERYKIILLGKSGVGKSACGNTILGRNAFVSKKSFKTVTQKIQMDTGTVDGVNLHVYDTPSFSDPVRNYDNFNQCPHQLLPDDTICTVVLLVMKADRLTPEDEHILNKIENIKTKLLLDTWILFTRGDELESEEITIEEFIEENDKLKEILGRFGNRFHLFNNRSQRPDQVRGLINKIKENAKKYQEMSCVQTITADPEKDYRHRKIVEPEKDSHHRRIVLLGKTGSGKSATGNTILGEERFKSEFSFNSVTEKSKREEGEFAGKNLTVIDTPGIFDTTIKPEEIVKEIGRSIYLSAPGAHAFLYVQPINTRVTEQEENVIERLEKMFGKEMCKYTIILFTHGDTLKNEMVNIDCDIKKNKSLSKVIDDCGGRYHIFNNTPERSEQQVAELLERIDRMVEQNGGSYYSNEMFEDAERNRKEEAARIRKEDEENQNKPKGFEAFCNKYKGSFYAGLNVGGTGVGAGVGSAIGAIIGACGGPVSVAAGAGIGAGVGAVVGAGTAALASVGIKIGMDCHKKRKSAGGESTIREIGLDGADKNELSSHSDESQNPGCDSERSTLIEPVTKKQK